MQISTGFLDIVFTEKDLHMGLYNGYILFLQFFLVFLKGEYLLFQQFSNHVFGFLHLDVLSCCTPQSRDQIYNGYELKFEKMLQLMNKKMKYNKKPTTLKRQKPIQTFLIQEGRPTTTSAVPHNYHTIACPMTCMYLSIHSFLFYFVLHF